MPTPINTFKKAIGAGQPQLGCWLGLADPYLAEISAGAGFDWVLVDGEHAPNDLRSVVAQLQVIEGSGCHPIVRLPIGETWMIKQYLDGGAQSLLIPMVESGAEAETLVKATRYPPAGTRGVGAALARASKFSDIPDYLTTADEQICLLVQVESCAGLAALDDILATDVDGVFIGPADLGADMGFLGQTDAPEVQTAVKDALRKIVASGKAAGVLTLDKELQKACIEIGATFVATQIDVTVFATGMRRAASEARALIETT